MDQALLLLFEQSKQFPVFLEFLPEASDQIFELLLHECNFAGRVATASGVGPTF